MNTRIDYQTIAGLDDSNFSPLNVEGFKSFDDFPKLSDDQVFFFTRSAYEKFVELVIAFGLKGVKDNENSAYEPSTDWTVRTGLFAMLNGRPLVTDSLVRAAHRRATLDGFYIVDISTVQTATEAEPETAEYTPLQVAELNFQRLVDGEVSRLSAEIFGIPSLHMLPQTLRAMIEDGMRYRALKVQRVRWLGCAGLENENLKADGYAHLGLELWTKIGPLNESVRESVEGNHNRAVDLLDRYTSIGAVTNAERLGFKA